MARDLSGWLPPLSGGDGENVGGKAEVFKQTVGGKLQLRTLEASGDKSVEQLANTVRLRPVPPGHFNVKDYGAVGDGVTDDTAALQTLINTATGTAGAGATIYLPPGNYYCASDLHLTRTVNLIGAAGGQSDATVGPASVIRFAAGKMLIVHGVNTGPYPGGFATNSLIKDIALLGAQVTLTAWAASHAYSVGDKIQATDKNRYYYECIKAGTSAGSEPDFRDGYFVDRTIAWPGVSQAVVLGTTIRDLAQSTAVFWECTTAGTTGGSSPTLNTTPSATTTDGSVVWTARSASGQWVTDGTAIWATRLGAGVWLRTRATVEGCHIENFTGPGVACLGTYYPYTNLNHFRLSHLRIKQCGVGIATRGYDASQGFIEHCDVEASGYHRTGTGGVGIWDGSFLGCQMIACEVAGHGADSGQAYVLGRYDLEAGSENGYSGTLLGCYSEGDCRASIIVGPGATVVGGDHGAGFSTDSSFASIGLSTGCRNIEEYTGNADNVRGLLAWRGTATVQAYRSDDDVTGYIGMTYEPTDLAQTGWWARTWNNGQFSGQAFSGFKADEGFGHEWTPYGTFRGGKAGDVSGRYYVGLDASMLNNQRVRRLGHFLAGDRFELQDDGTPGGWTGYIVKTSGYRGSHWQASTAVEAAGAGSPPYPSATIVEPTANLQPIPAPGGQVWKCTTGGTTGGSEPAWPGSPTAGVTTVSDGSAVWTFLGNVPEYARTGAVDDPITHTISQTKRVWADTDDTDASTASVSTQEREQRSNTSTTATTADQVLATLSLRDTTTNIVDVTILGFRPGTADAASCKLSGTFARSGSTVDRVGSDDNSTKTIGSLAASTFDLHINGTSIEIRATPGTAALVKWGVFSKVEEQYAPFDPRDFPATGLYFDYGGTLPWDGTASTGTSGSKSLNLATGGFSNSPDLGTLLNGHRGAAYDGTKDSYDSSHDASTFISLSAYRLVAVVVPASLPATSGFAPNDPGLVVCAGSVGLSVSSSGARLYHYDGSYQFADGPSALSLDDLHVIDVTFDGSTATVHVDGVAGTPVACGAVPSFSGQFHVGSNYNGTARFDGEVFEVQTYASDLAAVTPEAVYAYALAKFTG